MKSFLTYRSGLVILSIFSDLVTANIPKSLGMILMKSLNSLDQRVMM